MDFTKLFVDFGSFGFVCWGFYYLMTTQAERIRELHIEYRSTLQDERKDFLDSLKQNHEDFRTTLDAQRKDFVEAIKDCPIRRPLERE